jgi:osmotically-inducible protein OsmY
MHSPWMSACLSAALLASPLCLCTLANADASADRKLSEIVVTGKKPTDAAADERLAVQVESALAADLYFNSAHVYVTVSNGIATLHGIVFDDWDLRNAIRLSRRIPGVKRVVNDLEIKLGGE